MAMMIKKTEQVQEWFELVHPLDDSPEEKHDPMRLGPMHMTTSVRFSLMTLRAYLILMMLLVLYSVLHQSGIFGH